MAKSLITCSAAAAIGLCYVWQKNQIYHLGDEIKRRESVLTAAEKRNVMLAAQLAQLKSPARLEARCQHYNLHLSAPRENQIVRLYEPGPEWDVRLLPPALPAGRPQTKTMAQR